MNPVTAITKCEPPDNNDPTLHNLAGRVRAFLSDEHDERYEVVRVEREVGEWLERQVESLLEDGFDLLTAARYGHAADFRARLAGKSATPADS